MFPPQFDYYRAESVGEALDRLDTDRDVALLAGGHSLIPDLKNGRAELDAVVDISDLDDLRGIDRDADGIRIGALTTYATLAADAAVRTDATLLAAAAEHVGDLQIRNRGTLGGNLAYAHPAADPPAAAVAADATIRIRGRDGERTLSAEAFLCDGHALADAELVTEIRVPRAPEAGDAYVKKTHPATGYALLGVAARVRLDDGTVSDARLAATGVMDRTVRLRAAEDALVGVGSDDVEAIETAGEEARADLDDDRLRSDVQVSGEFRAHLLPEYVANAVTAAIDRAGDAPPDSSP